MRPADVPRGTVGASTRAFARRRARPGIRRRSPQRCHVCPGVVERRGGHERADVDVWRLLGDRPAVHDTRPGARDRPLCRADFGVRPGPVCSTWNDDVPRRSSQATTTFPGTMLPPGHGNARGPTGASPRPAPPTQGKRSSGRVVMITTEGWFHVERAWCASESALRSPDHRVDGRSPGPRRG